MPFQCCWLKELQRNYGKYGRKCQKLIMKIPDNSRNFNKMDVHTPDQRSYNMSKIGSKNTKPELLIRKLLWESGYRYRLHVKKLPGNPDIVFRNRKKVIFVNGCFWHNHKCKYFKWPESNKKFWRKKIEENVHRDNKNFSSLTTNGWSYLVIWECTFRSIRKANLAEKLQNVKDLIGIFLADDNSQCMVIDAYGIHKLHIPSEVSNG